MRVTGPPGSATPLTLSRGGCSAYKMNSQLISCSGGEKKRTKKNMRFSLSFLRIRNQDHFSQMTQTLRVTQHPFLEAPFNHQEIQEWLFQRMVLGFPSCYRDLPAVARSEALQENDLEA